jgi:DNA polymerase-3 subunit gamma/tau
MSSSLVLARKYRPKNFAEMVGQGHVVTALSNALQSQRLHHAYLFTGTRGVGKTTVSRILAKSLNCVGTDGQGGITATPCGLCAACTAIDTGRFVDYTELDAASNRGVDEVQSLLEQAVYKPVQGRFKVFMIDEVHMLTGHAFNAMLKTLEEPPEYLKFVLATTDPQKVPVTVLSRCLQFNLRPMAPETVQAHLQTVLAQEGIKAETGALKLLARGARGSMRDALSLTDQAIAFGAGSLSEAAVREMLGAVDGSFVLDLIAALAQGQGQRVVQIADDLRTRGLSAAFALEDMARVLQKMAVLQAVGAAAAAATGEDAQDTENAAIVQLAQQMPADETQLLYSMVIHGRAELGLAPDEYAGLVMTLLRLLAFKPAGFVPVQAGAGAGAEPEAEKKTLKPAPEVAIEKEAAQAGFAAQSGENTLKNPLGSTVATQKAGPSLGDMDSRLRGNDEAGGNDGAHLSGEAASANNTLDSRPTLSRGQALRGNDGASGDDAVGVSDMDSRPTLSRGQALRGNDGADGTDEASERGDAPAPALHLPVREMADAPTPREAPPHAEGDAAAAQASWLALVQPLVDSGAVQALPRELAIQSQCVAQGSEGADWRTLRVEQSALRAESVREKLQAALAAAGTPCLLRVEMGTVHDSWAKREHSKNQAAQSAAQEAFAALPLVQHLQQSWGGKIVPGSVQVQGQGQA